MTSIREQLLTALVATGFHDQECEEPNKCGTEWGVCATCMAHAAVKAARESTELSGEALDYVINCVQIDKDQMRDDEKHGHVTEAELAKNLAWADEVLKILGLECDCENLPYPNCPKCIEHMKADEWLLEHHHGFQSTRFIVESHKEPTIDIFLKIPGVTFDRFADKLYFRRLSELPHHKIESEVAK